MLDRLGLHIWHLLVYIPLYCLVGSTNVNISVIEMFTAHLCPPQFYYFINSYRNFCLGGGGGTKKFLGVLGGRKRGLPLKFSFFLWGGGGGHMKFLAYLEGRTSVLLYKFPLFLQAVNQLE